MKTLLAVIGVIILLVVGASVLLTAGATTPVFVVFGFIIGSLLVAATKKDKK